MQPKADPPTDSPEQNSWIVRSDETGATLTAIVKARMAVPWSRARALVESGSFQVDGVAVSELAHRLREGQTISRQPRSNRAANRDPLDITDDRILLIDPHLVVVNKPSGLSTVPFEEGERGTLVDRVRIWLHRRGHTNANPQLFVVHRIDKETSGLVVFARTWLAQRHLASLFRSHAIERAYLALCAGRVEPQHFTIESYLLEDRGDGLRGSARGRNGGVRAVTHVQVLQHLQGPSSLVQCTLETGRTHQLRIHLSERGHPILGDRVYSRRYEGPFPPAPRLLLHAGLLGFPHPVPDRPPVRIELAPPEDFTKIALQLGAKPGWEALSSAKNT